MLRLGARASMGCFVDTCVYVYYFWEMVLIKCVLYFELYFIY